MDIESFETKINKKHKFGVATLIDNGVMEMIKTYPNRDQLEADYRRLYTYASQKGITPPYPVELIGENGECRKCRILKELLH